jgi:hypothetical protein
MSNTELLGTEVFSAYLGDCEDPQIYAAQPLWEFQNSDVGKWVLENAKEQPQYFIRIGEWGYKVIVMADLSEKDKLFYELKYAK